MTTPTCPGCGGKFTHSNLSLSCTKCGLPDEIAAMGPEMIRRWKKQEMKDDGATKAQIRRALRGNPQRRRNKHGRKGVR